MREVIDAAREVTGPRDPRQRGAAPARRSAELVAASGRIRAELGWEPRKPALADMVADAWAFAQAHPHGYAARPPRSAPDGSARAPKRRTPRSGFGENRVLRGNDLLGERSKGG